jgi:hypothetical protein
METDIGRLKLTHPYVHQTCHPVLINTYQKFPEAKHSNKITTITEIIIISSILFFIGEQSFGGQSDRSSLT